MDDEPTRPTFRAVRGRRVDEPPSRRPLPGPHIDGADPTGPRRVEATSPERGEVIEPPRALLHVALARDEHHREWYIGILGKEWFFTAIYEIDRNAYTYGPMSLTEARSFVERFLQLIAELRVEGWQPARLQHCEWSGLEPPSDGILPPTEPEASRRG